MLEDYKICDGCRLNFLLGLTNIRQFIRSYVQNYLTTFYN
jgi:hypothetical protein